MRFRPWMGFVGVAVALGASTLLRPYFRPAIPPADPATVAHVERVRILRDTWGVPHVFGQSDADAAFGLAYAHAEDDWPTIQAVLAAGRGQLGLVHLSMDAVVADFYAHFVRAMRQASVDYPSIDPATRAVLEAYARGLTHFARTHPDQVDTRLLPFQGLDVAAGFAHKLSFMAGVPAVLKQLDAGEITGVGSPVAARERAESERSYPGSNAHAVTASRSADGISRLNVNSHQPWTGPVAWYEAQVHSEEGWNMTGGLFPGSPFVLHGHNDRLGWAHTVNAPDLIDVFALVTDPERPGQYRLDGEWRAIEKDTVELVLDVGPFDLKIARDVFWSVHGPVMPTAHGSFAVRWAGLDRGVHAATQWYRMNKARNFDEWRAAMAVQAIPMFHTVYADRTTAHYVYNALLFARPPGHDYARVLPGDVGALVVQQYVPYAELPQVTNPASGFVQACNSAPWVTTSGPENPRREAFPVELGIESAISNRTHRTLALLGDGKPVTREAFLALKWDQTYDDASGMNVELLQPLLGAPGFVPRTPDEEKAIALLRAWDRRSTVDSVGASIATLALKVLLPVLRAEDDPPIPDAAAALRHAIAWLVEHHGRVDVPLGEVQRLRRGALDLAIGGGPDLLNAVYTERSDGHLVGIQGDSYVLVVEWGPDGVARSESIHQFGASSRPDSEHFADQAPLFVAHQLKPVWRTEADIRAHLEREYRPGE